MRILVVEDDLDECNRIIECAKQRRDIELVAVTDSDVDAIKQVKIKNPDGIMLDLELNNSSSGNTDSFGFLESGIIDGYRDITRLSIKGDTYENKNKAFILFAIILPKRTYSQKE